MAMKGKVSRSQTRGGALDTSHPNAQTEAPLSFVHRTDATTNEVAFKRNLDEIVLETPPYVERPLSFETAAASGDGSIARSGDTITMTPGLKENPLTFTTMLDSTNSQNAFSLSRGTGTDTVALIGPATVEHPLTFETASSASGDGSLARSGDTVTYTPPDKESPLTFEQGIELTNSVNFSRTGNTVRLVMPSSVEKPLTFQTASSASGNGELTRSGETITYTPPDKEDPLTFQTASSASGNGDLTRTGNTVTFTPPDKEDPLTFQTAAASGSTPTLSRSGNTVTFRTTTHRNYQTRPCCADALSSTWRGRPPRAVFPHAASVASRR